MCYYKRLIQERQMLSFGLKLLVWLNDPCVLKISYPKLGVCAHKDTHTHTYSHLVWHSLNAGWGLWLLHGSRKKVSFVFFFLQMIFFFLTVMWACSGSMHSSAHTAKTVSHFLNFTMCLHLFIQQSTALVLIVCASPAFWALICVHNKQVQGCRIRVESRPDLCFRAFHYSTKAWGRLTGGCTEWDKTGITF